MKKLQTLRAQIDRLDEQLLRLLNQRAQLSQQIGVEKRATDSNIVDSNRENSLLDGLLKRNKGPISAEALQAIFREILSTSRTLQKPLTVACLGPEGSYSHQAVAERFGSGGKNIFCNSFQEVFETVSREEADFGVVPIENSIEGGVNATHDCLATTDLKVCGEQYVKIDHVLCARPDHKKIQHIYSHPQALAQCRQWQQKHYPKAKLLDIFSTAEAPRRVRKSVNAAAISSPMAAQLCGLEIIARSISDAPDNTTRFLILNRTGAEVKPSKNTKTSLIFAVTHEVGALSSVLNIFAANKLNLQKIESRPAPHKAWEYLFFVDISGHQQQSSFQKALKQIKKKTLWRKILGSYPS